MLAKPGSASFVLPRPFLVGPSGGVDTTGPAITEAAASPQVLVGLQTRWLATPRSQHTVIPLLMNAALAAAPQRGVGHPRPRHWQGARAPQAAPAHQRPADLPPVVAVRAVSAPSSCRKRSAGSGSVIMLASTPPSVVAAAWRPEPLQPLTANEPASAAGTPAPTNCFVEPRRSIQASPLVDSSDYYSSEINL